MRLTSQRRLRRFGLPGSAGFSRRSGPSFARCPPPGGRLSWPSPYRLSWVPCSVSPRSNQWSTMTARSAQTFDPTACSLFGVVFVGALLLGALAVRSVTAEYSTGMIRSSFTATPNRRLVLAAKAAVTAAFVLPGGTARCRRQLRESASGSSPVSISRCPSGLLAFFRPWSSEPWRVSLIAIIGVGLGGLIRHTAGATTALVLVIVGGTYARPVASSRPPSVPPRNRTRGRSDSPLVGGPPEARYRHHRPRRLCRYRPGCSIDASDTPRRLTLPNNQLTRQTQEDGDAPGQPGASPRGPVPKVQVCLSPIVPAFEITPGADWAEVRVSLCHE